MFGPSRKGLKKDMMHLLKDAYDRSGEYYTEQDLKDYFTCGTPLPKKVWRTMRWRAMILKTVELMKLEGVKKLSSLSNERVWKQQLTERMLETGCPRDMLKSTVELYLYEMRSNFAA